MWVISDWKENKGEFTSNLQVSTLDHSKWKLPHSKIRGWGSRTESIPKSLTIESSKLTCSILNCFDFSLKIY